MLRPGKEGRRQMEPSELRSKAPLGDRQRAAVWVIDRWLRKCLAKLEPAECMGVLAGLSVLEDELADLEDKIDAWEIARHPRKTSTSASKNNPYVIEYRRVSDIADKVEVIRDLFNMLDRPPQCYSFLRAESGAGGLDSSLSSL